MPSNDHLSRIVVASVDHHAQSVATLTEVGPTPRRHRYSGQLLGRTKPPSRPRTRTGFRRPSLCCGPGSVLPTSSCNALWADTSNWPRRSRPVTVVRDLLDSLHPVDRKKSCSIPAVPPSIGLSGRPAVPRVDVGHGECTRSATCWLEALPFAAVIDSSSISYRRSRRLDSTYWSVLPSSAVARDTRTPYRRHHATGHTNPGATGSQRVERSRLDERPGRSAALFAGLGRRHLNKVAALSRIRRFHEGATIVAAGQPGDMLYVLLDGEVSVRRRSLPTISRGMRSFFGEMALLDGGPRSATVVAKGPVVCLTISRSGFQKLLRKEPGISAALLQELAARLRAADAATRKQPVTE